MQEKRKDSKGRVLRNGEAQRKDGCYMFRYIDAGGERRTVYSWKLVETDKVPTGKRCEEALRTIEERVLSDKKDGIRTGDSERITLNTLFDDYISDRTDLKETTRCNYLALYNKHVRGKLGTKPIGSIRYSDVYKAYMDLSRKNGLKISSIQNINASVWKVFDKAVRDDLIRKNPADDVMREISHALKEEPNQRHALTLSQQAAWVKYIYGSRDYKKYGPLFTVLLGTGMRIGEALGLRWKDIDFKNNVISVNHSLSYKATEGGGYKYRISSPKTKAGIRQIPMFQDVRKAFQKEKRKKKNTAAPEFTVDGYSGFVFLNSAGKVYTPTFIFDVIQNITTDYNREESILSEKENRDPVYIPKISAHIFRHTFCTRLCENESNLKIIQDVMGHKNIRTTMDVYNEATADAKRSSFESLEGKILLA